MRAIFETGRDGGPMTRIDGLIYFPGRRDWPGKQPLPGETWEVEIAGKNSRETVGFLRPIKSPHIIAEEKARELAETTAKMRARDAEIAAASARERIDRAARDAEMVEILRAVGTPSPRPVAPAASRRPTEVKEPNRYEIRRTGWESPQTSQLPYGERLRIDRREGTAVLDLLREEQGQEYIPESPDGYRAGGYIDARIERVVKEISAPASTATIIAEAHATYRAEEAAHAAYLRALDEYREAEAQYDHAVKEWHDCVEKWGGNTLANWLAARGYCLVEGEPMIVREGDGWPSSISEEEAEEVRAARARFASSAREKNCDPRQKREGD